MSVKGKRKTKLKSLEARSLNVSAFLSRNTQHLQKWAVGQGTCDWGSTALSERTSLLQISFASVLTDANSPGPSFAGGLNRYSCFESCYWKMFDLLLCKSWWIIFNKSVSNWATQWGCEGKKAEGKQRGYYSIWKVCTKLM